MKTLLCAGCSQEKTTDEFSVKTGSKTGYQRLCKLCNSANVSKYYRQNKYKDKYSNKARKYKTKVIDIIRGIKLQYKCCVCKEDEPVCLDFHHLNKEEKDFEISMLIAGKNLEYLATELCKCVVICSNCHRKVHYNIITLENTETISISIEDLRALIPKSPRQSKYESEEQRILARREKEKVSICDSCGGKCCRKATRCKECSLLLKTLHMPSKEQLIEDFKVIKTFVGIAKKYEVSDNTIRSWKKKYCI